MYGEALRTNVVLDEAKVATLVRLTGARSKTAAVALAVDEQIRREKLRRLSDLLGRVPVDEDAVRDLREADRKKAARLAGEDRDGK